MNVSNNDDELLDATVSPLEEAVPTSTESRGSDPALAIIAALAQELATIYAGNTQALEAANRALRSAIGTHAPIDK